MALNFSPETLCNEERPSLPLPSLEELSGYFPQLEIIGLLGRGGMGAVYKARQKQLDRIVALKILPPGIGEKPTFAERFTREARALAKLHHPNIVTLYEFGEAGGLFYFLMEFVDGLNLRQLLDAGNMGEREALAIVPQICEALQFAHDQGIVHRDIKPENILLDRRGQVKVADFGLAKIIQAGNETPAEDQTPSSSPDLSMAGKVMGTPSYMAPEQTGHPDAVDHRADIYALGVVFYQMLTGELPVGRFAPPSRKVQIDVRLDEVVLRALEKEPELRYQQASVLKTQVETIAGENHAVEMTHHHAPILEYRSKTILFGLPLLHITSGMDAETGRPLLARGIIAIGGRARGVIAVGGTATGVFAFGGVSFGLFAYGGIACGLFSLGGLALALFAALGGGAIAPVALGGLAAGIYAYGGQGYGLHVEDHATRDPAALHFFGMWAETVLNNFLWINMVLLILMMASVIIVPTIFLRRNAAKWEKTEPRSSQSLGTISFLFALMSMLLPMLCYWFKPIASLLTQEAQGFMLWLTLLSSLLAVSLGILARKSRLGFSSLILGGISFSIWILFFVANLVSQQKTPHELSRVIGKNLPVDASPKAVTFGPIVERVITLGNSSNSFYSLEKGSYVPGAKGFQKPSDESDSSDQAVISRQALWKWLTANDVDLFALRHNGMPTLASSEMVIFQIMPTDRFDRMTPEELAKDPGWRDALAKQLRVSQQCTFGDKYTLAFQTRYGVTGLLQVTGILSNPPGVKIRYKLLQNEHDKTILPLIQSWLSVMDSGDYAKSWQQAAQSFHDAVTQEKWGSMSESVRKPLGKVLSRTNVSIQPIPPPEGFPAGNYAEAHFDTSFEKLTAAKETVTMMQEKDGVWRTIAYLILPDEKPGKGNREPSSPAEKNAVTAALSWLGEIDAGNYSQSWKETDVYFQKAVTDFGWSSTLTNVRQPLGALISRKLKSVQESKSLPGAPDGDYVVMQFDTSFSACKTAVETVTFIRQKDDSWKAIGYYIR